MVPPAFLSTTPLGERTIFEKLKRDSGTEDWIVLHSLGIKDHPYKVQAEADFIVLAPQLGILCIEVKGCDVSRVDGTWTYHYPSGPVTTPEGPFRQASSAAHSIRSYIGKHDKSLARLLVWSAVVFPAIEFDDQSPEWHAWQCIDRQALGARRFGDICADVLSRAHRHMRESGKHWYDSARSKPSSSEAQKVADLLRGNFEHRGFERFGVDHVEQVLDRFTEEQYLALDEMSANERILFEGAAGTGKTSLALESARRASEEGKRVLLVCYNRLLGSWIRDSMERLPSWRRGGSEATTLHSLMQHLTGGAEDPTSDSQAYWTHLLPDRCISSLIMASGEIQYDVLIVDEAQDLVLDGYLDVMDLLLKGGLSSGRWSMFGDFDRQSIFAGGANASELKDLLAKRASARLASRHLRTNCRNAPMIANAVTAACNLQPGYARVLNNNIDGRVNPHFYDSEKKQKALLESLAGELSSTLGSESVRVLSLRRDEVSCAALLQAEGSRIFVPLRSGGRDREHVNYATVHAFKGLESPAIILTDIDNLDDLATQRLLYIGMSRARVTLDMLMHQRCQPQYLELLKKGLSQAGR